MKRTSRLAFFAPITVLCLVAGLWAQAQGPSGETKEEERPPETPDFSDFHLIPDATAYFVVRGSNENWVSKEEKGDLRLAWSQAFSKDPASKEVVAMKLYPTDEKTPCVLEWKEDKAWSILFEDDKYQAEEPSGNIFVRELTDPRNGSTVGVMFSLIDHGVVTQHEYLLKRRLPTKSA